MKKLPSWIYADMLVLGIAWLVFLALVWSSVAAEDRTEQAATPVPADPQAEQLRAALQNEQLSEADRSGLEEKLAMAERMATDQATGGQSPREEKVAPPLPNAAKSMAEPNLVGIFEGSQGLIQPSEANILNVWQGEYNGALTQVFAGSLPDQPEQGIVLVVRFDPESMKRSKELRLAPEATGALRIIEAQDNFLILSASDGSRLIFNLDTLSFGD